MQEAVCKNDLLIRQKCEAMIAYGHAAVRHFPKMERHVLGAEIRATMWAVLRLIVVCNKRYHKKTTLQDDTPQATQKLHLSHLQKATQLPAQVRRRQGHDAESAPEYQVMGSAR